MRSTIHEMRNQLAVAVANIEAFIDGKFKPTPDRLNCVLQALLEVDVLIDGLRSSGISEPTTLMQRVDVCDLVLQELISMEATAEAAGIELRIDPCATVHAAFTCDPGQVSQIVKNVLLNALKYTPRGGVVAVDCHHEPGVMALAVSDDGPGVLPEERTSIFAPGVRGSASHAFAGSGMGLAVVARLVGAHGGTVTVDRSDLGGARFVVRLPGS
jgi:signal transduction histidine kinase